MGGSQDNCPHNGACWGTEGMLWTYSCPSCGQMGRGTTLKLAKEAFAEEEKNRIAAWVRLGLSCSLSIDGDRDAADEQSR